MRFKVIGVLTLVLCLFALSTPIEAQEEESQLYFVRVFTVKPSRILEYSAAMEKMVAKCKEFNFPHPWYAWTDGEFHYYYFVPVDGYEGVDKFYRDFDPIIEKWGSDAYQEFMVKAWAMYESYQEFYMGSMPKFVYDPEKPRLKPGEGNYAIWDMSYVKIGKEKEFLDIVSEILSLNKSKRTTESVRLFYGARGTERPLYMITLFGKDAGDFWTHNKKMWEALGEEASKLYYKSLSLLRKREIRQFWYLENTSYAPEEK